MELLFTQWQPQARYVIVTAPPCVCTEIQHEGVC